MAENPERLAQIMQRMQVSNQRTLGNRFGGGYSGVSSATAPTPPSEPIDFSRNTLSPPSMAEPDDTGPGQQMPSVIQPPASGNVGMPSGGNAYSGSQPGVSPSTRDLYSLPDYSGGMRGGMGGDDRLDRLLKMLSSYMGSQMAPPSAAPPPAPVEATPPSIDQQELQNPVEYTGGSQLPAPSPAPTPAPAQEGIGYVPAIGVGTPGQVTPDMVRIGGSRVEQADEPRMSTMQYTPEQYARDQARRASGNLNERELMQKNNPEMYNSAMRIPQANDTPEQQEQSRRAKEWYSSQQRPITNDPKSPNFNPNLNAYGEKGPDISLATIESAALSPGGLTPDMQMLRNKLQSAQPSPQLKGLIYPKPGAIVDTGMSTLYNPETGEYATGGGGVRPEPGSAWRQATSEESKLRPSSRGARLQGTSLAGLDTPSLSSLDGRS